MMDDLTAAVEATDLPGLIADLYPESTAKPGVTATVYAVWRGNTNTPSFSLYKRNGVWLFSDKATMESGNAFDFLTRIHGMTGAEAGKFLKDLTGTMPQPPSGQSRERRAEPRVKVHEPKPIEAVPLEADPATAFLTRARDKGPHRPSSLSGRGLLARDLDDFMVVADGDDALIPMFSPDGELLTVKRRIAKPGKMKYKYEFAGHGSPPWVSDNLGDPRIKNVLIVEGELNGMVAYSVARERGWSLAVIGVAGAEGGLYHSPLSGRRVYAYGDGDEPGQRARERWLEEARFAGARSGLRVLSFEEDFCDLAGADRKGFADRLQEAMTEAEPLFDIGERRIATSTINEMWDATERALRGEILVPTGFKELDDYTGGLPEHDLTVVAALPGTGKSAFLRHVLLTRLDQSPDNRVLLFTPDQDANSIFRLIASARTGIPWQAMRRQAFHPRLRMQYGDDNEIIDAWKDAYREAMEGLSTRLILSEKQDFEEVRQEIWRTVEEGVSMVAFDYIQMFEIEGDQKNGGAVQVMRDLKSMATTTAKVPMVLAAQLAKYKFGQGRRSGIPIVTDIEGTGKYHQLPNQIYLLYNQQKYLSTFSIEPADYPMYDELDAGKARVYVAKNKMGEDGNFKYLRWNPEVVAFRSMTEPGW